MGSVSFVRKAFIWFLPLFILFVSIDTSRGQDLPLLS